MKRFDKNGVAKIPMVIALVIVIILGSLIAIQFLSPPSGLYPDGMNPALANAGIDTTISIGISEKLTGLGIAKNTTITNTLTTDIYDKTLGLISLPRLLDLLSENNVKVTLKLTGPEGYEVSQTKDIKVYTNDNVSDAQPVFVKFDRCLIYETGVYHSMISVKSTIDGQEYINTYENTLFVNIEKKTIYSVEV